MTGYILSILGIVVAGVVLDIIIPSGSISKFIKSMYAIFVLAVIINPIVKFFSKTHDFTIHYEDYEVNEQLMNFINREKVDSMEEEILARLNKEGFENIDIIINYSSTNLELSLNSCEVNLKNLVIREPNEHINKYEFIVEVVQEITNLELEVIIFNE